MKLPNSIHEAGYTQKEIEEILKDYPNINKDKFNSALTGITCMMNSKGEILIYPCDLKLAIKCGIENREPNNLEWD